MAVIAPFKGLTYNFYQRNDLSPLMAPPYDVISPEEQEAYYHSDPHNVIRLILGKKKTGDSDWDNRYTRAADYFQRWQSDGTLIRAKEPCLYLTALTYDPGNGDPIRVRWGLIALVRIEEADSNVVLPHERTFSAHKDDRLKLFRACNAQFSQIFGLYEDSENRALNACRETADSTPHMNFEFKDGTRHQLWILKDPRLFKTVSTVMQDKTIFIADGHHRYETSRNYRNIMRARYGRRPANRAYEFVMMYLSNLSDEGLTILPSHRLVTRVEGFQVNRFLKSVSQSFHIKTFHAECRDLARECKEMKQRLKDAGEEDTAIAFRLHGSDQWYLFSLKPGMREQLGQDLHPSLRELDVLVLSRLILQKSLGFTKEDLDDEEIFHYESSIRKAVSQVESGEYQLAFLLNPTRMAHVKEVAGNSLVMPRKSTYFYPKVLSGLVFNKIDPHEYIQVP
ncbi:MAG: DUF1015 domain-containing protein [Deltaproteobacteria bacterium]|nr:DUF1015 domain-containing protein [Deltaproteobacteria bacterium]MCF8119379.1 DUF1015 domain-containing protein [Deltaproteobacteria bacterium]